eukprot:SAG31_NODE_1369_length_8611_cov_3.505169_2_plen_82_part_00
MFAAGDFLSGAGDAWLDEIADDIKVDTAKNDRAAFFAAVQASNCAGIEEALQMGVDVVRSFTFSFLWDFSPFHGTNREIRD